MTPRIAAIIDDPADSQGRISLIECWAVIALINAVLWRGLWLAAEAVLP